MKSQESKTILVLGASRGLGRAFVDGLGQPGDHLIGVSRSSPEPLPQRRQVTIEWIEADLCDPLQAVETVAAKLGDIKLDATIYNLGLWETDAFTDEYQFTRDSDEEIMSIIAANLTTPILLLKRILPQILKAQNPRVILTGSTSALRQAGRPEVAFGATKHALNGIADALREGYRDRRLGITTLQIGYLNTEDSLEAPRHEAECRGGGTMIPVHDVVATVQNLLDLSASSYVRELVLPAIFDARF